VEGSRTWGWTGKMRKVEKKGKTREDINKKEELNKND
jgi:hypothetical protein